MSHPRTRSAGSGAAGVATRATRKWGTPEVPPPETPTAQHTTTEETEAKPKPRRSRRSYTLSELEHPCFSLHGPGARIRLCTSGYSYQHWHQEGSFYAGLPASAEFEAYSKEFDCVELNGTFYGWFSEATFDKWRERALAVRPSFEYVVKASNMYTHKKRLNVDDFFVASWGRFWERCLRLGPTLGPVLFQFPANFKRTPTPTPKSGKRGTGALDVQPSDNLERLKALGRLLLPEGRFAFEFRDASWFHEEVYAVLREHNWCLALVDVTGAGKDDDDDWSGTLRHGPNPPPEQYPLDSCPWGVYLRFHGAGGKYTGAYVPKRMAAWAERIRYWTATGRRVYTAFNNTDDGTPPSAIADARDLAAALRRLGVMD